MGNEIRGYYCKKRKTLLKDFNQTIDLMKNEQKHSEIITDSVQNELLLEFENIIPEIPYFKGYRQRMFNNMLIMTSQALAAHKVFSSHDKKPDEVWEICHTALLLRLKKMPSIKKWLIEKMWNTLFRAVMMRRAQRDVKEILCNFELEYIKGNGEDYDYGVNYTECGIQKFLREHEAEGISPYVCLADISFSDAFGWGLTRTQTIGDGCTYCDFRFKKGAATRITSKTPEVQKMIDKFTS